MIEIKNVTLGYKHSTDWPIRDLSYTIPTTGVVAVTGASGTGKSTLLKGIAGLLRPIKGSIESKGHVISMVFQEDRLISTLTLEENIMFVQNDNAKVDPKKLHRVLTDVELEKYSDLPVDELSGGMQRRAAIARAMMYGGNTVILDEPLTGLDILLKERVAKRIRKRFPLVIVSIHDFDEAMLFTLPCEKVNEIHLVK